LLGSISAAYGNPFGGTLYVDDPFDCVICLLIPIKKGETTPSKRIVSPRLMP
jgi:hypothetical protein